MPDDHDVLDGSSASPLDARRLRGLAHPLRVRILELLELDGPATATMLADRLNVRSGSTSWHLLKLAENGFVEEVDRGDRRRRWWRAVQRGWSMDHSDFAEDPELADASEILLGAVVSQQMLRANRFLRQEWSADWRQSWILSTELGLRLDPAGMAALREDLWKVIERYRAEPVAAESGTEQIVFQMQGFPYRAVES